MLKKNLWLLILGLGLFSGTIIVNRFIVSVPNWLATVLAITAGISIIMFMITNRKQAK